ncbi:sugar ABC transporter ATP-binding protein [Amantichitinum ursilacus]|uniref:Ribose import ATP-binding protein RbsA n=1 Tax=Amantichitinum ursilacus TaxID=857265 RepID=A0A0N0XGA1_9NEIS|nr:sugar ABC transporter ATP-binding protein [Amantichitinum ursilacus]KPC49899.1 Ribose import ATP-binding protein RbsA [Amantichitinum ursilacus]
MSELVLDVKGVSKRFGAVRALDNVQLQVHSHEILALMGENGAGKSTLMKVLSGVYQPDAGEIRLGGQTIKVHSPADARAAGINLIYQELAVAPHMSVAQNVFMGSEPRGRFGRVDTGLMTRKTNEILASLGARFSADTLAGSLGIADQQQVEIARSLIHKSKVLIMDEPTAALSDRETERLFEVIRRLRNDGIAIVYISHRMAEMVELADRVSVMRDGGYVGTLPREEATPERVIQMMVGRPLGDFYQRRETTTPGPVRLEVRNMHSDRIHGASFAVRAGEVLGLAGLVGAGRTELARLVFGADELHQGEILLDGQVIKVKEPLDAIRRGIAYLPEDRKGQGLFLQLSALANTTMSVLGRNSRFGILNHKGLRRLTEDAIKQLAVKVPGPDGIVGGLSGGNQQKILLARWLAIKPKVLILDEPTRGVDVGAKSEIYRIINQLAASGVAVVVISSELPEVIGICDRVLVMREGHISGELGAGQINQEAIMTLATHLPAAVDATVTLH